MLVSYHLKEERGERGREGSGRWAGREAWRKQREMRKPCGEQVPVAGSPIPFSCYTMGPEGGMRTLYTHAPPKELIQALSFLHLRGLELA